MPDRVDGRGAAGVAGDAGSVPGEYTRWLGELRRYVHRLTGDRDLAEDVAQDAVVRLMRADPRLITNARAWLYRAATNLVRDHARREAMLQRKHVPDVEIQPLTPDEELERAETIRNVRAALELIPQRDRELLILRESGFKHAEIAEVMGVTTNSVSVLAARALQRFRTAYLARAGA